MRYLLLDLTIALATVALPAQTRYAGLVDGAHPFRVTLQPDGITGSYEALGLQAPLDLVGACLNEACKYTARDSAFVLDFTPSDSANIYGTLRLGDGRQLAFTAAQTTEIGLLPANCSEGKWLRAYTSSDSSYRFALAALPGGRISGSVYAAALGTNLSVRGQLIGNELDLTLFDESQTQVGRISFADNTHLLGDQLTGTLAFGESQQALSLQRTQSLPMACLSSGSRVSLTHPLTQLSRSDRALGELSSEWWAALTASAGTEANGWFEPTRLDERVLSGWMHLVLPEGPSTTGVTIDLKSGRVLRDNALLGPRKTRTGLQQRAVRDAARRHPLRSVEDFQRWARKATLEEVAVTPEGLILGGRYHPIFGQLTTTERWEDLPHLKRLPDWLATSPHKPYSVKP